MNVLHSFLCLIKKKLYYNFLWYGKYGFKPFNTKLNNYNDILLKSYNKNIEIMNSITIKEANILIYIELTEKKQIIEDVKKLLETNPDMLLKNFLSLFLKITINIFLYFMKNYI